MNDRARQRVFVLRVLVLSLVATLLGRLWYLQVLSGPTYRAAAASNQVRELVDSAPRGQILDDEGRALARNRYEYVVTVNNASLAAQKDRGKQVLRRLAPVVGLSLPELTQKIRLCGPKVPQPCYTGSPYQPVPVKNFDPADSAALQRALVVVERSELFRGVEIAEQPVRIYPDKALASHEIGYLQPITGQELTSPQFAGYQPTELVGKQGLEKQYDRQLRGVPAVRKVSVNAHGDVTGTLSTTQPVPGDTLVTNLDGGLQQALAKELVNGIKLAQGQAKGYLATTASGVVVDVQTGAVLAMASVPNYDPNQFIGGISQAQFDALQTPEAGSPLISRAFDAAFPPGSTFKGSSSVAILANHINGATPGTVTMCPPSYQVGNQAFANFEGESFAPVDNATALEVSCDTYFYQFAYYEWIHDGGLKDASPLGPARQDFARTAKQLGYGAPSGVDLPSESAGVVFDRAKLYRYWQQNKADFCSGATKYAKTDPQRAAQDADACATGYRLYAGNAVQFAIGQGSNILASPLQQAMAYAAIGNGGTLFTPQLARAFIKPNGSVDRVVAPKVRSVLNAAQKQALSTVREGLTLVVQGSKGTAKDAGFDKQLDVGGKTGTADVANQGPLNGQPDAWFVGLQPMSAPRYAVVVMIEHGGQGGIAAAQTVANVYKDIYGLDGHPVIWPDGIRPTTLPKLAATGEVKAPQVGIVPVTPQAPLLGGTPDPVAVANARKAIQDAKAKAAAAAAQQQGGP